MDTVTCSFCTHGNPEDAKFCNACGSSMHLQLCKHCGAIDNVSASACYKCGTSFSSSTDSEVRAGTAGTAAADPEAADEGPVAGSGAPRQLDAPPADGTLRVRREVKQKGPMKALALLLVAVAAVLLYRFYGPAGDDGSGVTLVHDAERASPGAIDATLGAVPPSSAKATGEIVPVTTPAPAATAAAPAPEALPLSVDSALPDASGPEPASTPGDDGEVPPGEPACTPEVTALGLCD